MHHKPSPVIRHGQMRSAAEQQAESEKEHYQDCAQDIKIDQLPEIRDRWICSRFVAHGAINNYQPGEKSDKKENLPKPAQFEEFPSLVPKPEPQVAEHPFDPGHFARKTPDGNQKHRSKQNLNQKPLFARFSSTDDWRKIDRRCHPGRCYPENGKLQMPRFCPAVGDELPNYRDIKTSGVNGVVRKQAAERGLQQKQQNHHQKIFCRLELARGERHIHKFFSQRNPLGLAIKEAIAVHPKNKQSQGHKKRNDAGNRPDIGFRSGNIARCCGRPASCWYSCVPNRVGLPRPPMQSRKKSG